MPYRVLISHILVLYKNVWGSLEKYFTFTVNREYFYFETKNTSYNNAKKRYALYSCYVKFFFF